MQNNNTIFYQKSKTKTSTFSLSSLCISIMIVIIMILILVSPVRYAQSIIKGLKLFFNNVLPGLLPFMFLSKLLTGLGLMSKLSNPMNKPMQKFFGLTGESFYAFLISAISGYPVGSKITSDLYNQGKIDKIQLTNTAIISSTSGPIYVIGAVGGLMLNDVKSGVIIYIINILSVLLVSFIGHIFTKRKQIQLSPAKNNETTNKKSNNLLLSTVQDTTLSLLTVAFYISLFSLIIDLLRNLKVIEFLVTPINNLFKATSNITATTESLFSGIIEMTNGAKSLATTNHILTLPLISFVTGFSGISIIMQSLSFLSSTPIKKSKFVLYKFLQGLTSFTLTFLYVLVV